MLNVGAFWFCRLPTAHRMACRAACCCNVAWFPSCLRRRYAVPRPEGQRCLLIAARGQTVARLRNGALLERFGSPLPAGGRGQPAGDDSFCILDCIFHAPDQTYYVLGEGAGFAGPRRCRRPTAHLLSLGPASDVAGYMTRCCARGGDAPPVQPLREPAPPRSRRRWEGLHAGSSLPAAARTPRPLLAAV